MGILNIDEHVEEHRLMAIRYPDNAVITAQNRSADFGGSVVCPGKNSGAVINEFTSATGVTFSGTAGYSGAVDGTIPSPDGGNSAWVICPLASGASYARINLTQNVRLAATDSISFRFFSDDPSAIRFFQLTIVQGAHNIKRSATSDGSYDAGGWGWHTITWKLSDFTVTGSPDYGSDFTLFEFQIGLGGTGGGQGRVALSKLRKNAASSSFVLFSNDAGYDDVMDAKDIFASSGVPLNVYLRCDKTGQSGYLTASHVTELANHPSRVFEFGSYPDYLPALNHTTNGIALSQAVGGAGNLTLAGSLCTAGVANLGASRKVVLSTASINKTIQFTITGTLEGNAVSETVMGCAVGGEFVESRYYYDTVTQIAVSAAISGNCTVGTSYSVAEHSAAILTQLGSMRAAGLQANMLHFAYAGGQLSEPLHSALVSSGAITGRPNIHSQTVPRNMLIQDAAWNPLLLSAQNAGLAIATMKSMVDDIVSRGGVLVFYWHTLAAAVDGVNPTFEHLAEIVAYCKGKHETSGLGLLKLSDLERMIKNKSDG